MQVERFNQRAVRNLFVEQQQVAHLPPLRDINFAQLRAQFIRITGLDQQAANEAFSAFLSDNDLTQEQMVFVKTVVDFVVRNGVLELKHLQEEPFRSAGSILAFPTETGKKLIEAIKGINRNAGYA